MNDIAQWTAVAIIIVIAAVAAVRRLRRRRSGGGCSGCALKDNCLKKDDTTRPPC